MAVVVIDTIKPKNQGTFPVVEAVDVKVTNDKRLDAALNDKANQSDLAALQTTVSGKASQADLTALSETVSGKASQADLTALSNTVDTKASAADLTALSETVSTKAAASDLATTNATVATKANASDVTTADANLQAQIDNIVSGSTADSEVINARVGEDGTSYTTLKERLDTENENTTASIGNVQSDVSTLNSGFFINLFDKNSVNNVRGKYIAVNGNIVDPSDNRFCYSHAIPVKPNTKYTFLRDDNFFGNVSQYAYSYKGTTFKGAIEGVKSRTAAGVTVSTITTAANADSIRINYIYASNPMFVEGEVYPDIFCAYGKLCQNSNLKIFNSVASQENAVKINALESGLLTYKQTIKSWSKLSVLQTGYIDTNGVRHSSDYLKISDYVRVKAGDTITAAKMKLDIGGATIYGIACYDSDKTFIPNEGLSGSSNNFSGSFVVPEGCAYIAVSEQTADVSSFNIQEYTAEIGEQVTQNSLAIAQIPDAPLKGRKIVNFGDSIFGQARPPQDISTFLAERTGATVYNCGFGGCRMGRHSSEIYDAFSMYRLAYSIANNDWTLQDAALEDTSLPDYFATTISLMKSLDWSEIDICTIAYGTNDFADGLRPYRAVYGKDNFLTYTDSLRYSIETLLGEYPNLRIFVITPHYRFWLNSGEFVDDSNTHEVTSWVDQQNYKLTDYVQAGKDVAKEYQLPVIDDYYDLGFNQFNRSVYYPSYDGTHQNVTGRKMIAEHIAAKLY